MSEGKAPISYSAFICHAEPDAERAEEICATLEERGLRCWMAPRDVPAGRDEAEEIVRGIETSRCVVLLLSEAANASPVVKRVVERAVSKKKPVFPVRVEDVMPSPALELFVASTHWIDAFTGSLVDHIDHLAHNLADEKALAEGTEVSARIALRRKLPRWIGMGMAGVVVVAAIVVGTLLSRRFDARSGEGQVARPAPSPAGAAAPPTTVRVLDLFSDHARSLGIDPASLKASDFRATIHPNSDITGGHVLRITAQDKILRLLEASERKYTLPGASKAEPFFTWATQLPADPPPPKSGELTIEFLSVAHGTGPRHAIGPFRIPLHEGPPVSGMGTLIGTLDAKSRADVGANMAKATREALDRHRESMRNAAPKERPDPQATLDALKAAFQPTEATAVVAKRITLSPELEKELGITSDVPANTGLTSMLDPRTVMLMGNQQRKTRWWRASAALSNHGLSKYSLGDTPALVAVPAQPLPGGNLKGWASLREVRVGASAGAMTAVPVQATLLDVRRGRIPIYNYGMHVWLAELPGDAKQVVVQFVYTDGDVSKVIEVPIEDVVLK